MSEKKKKLYWLDIYGNRKFLRSFSVVFIFLVIEDSFCEVFLGNILKGLVFCDFCWGMFISLFLLGNVYIVSFCLLF